MADGFVYRLLTKEFYDHEIEAFSSPELIRTPLEKLILKIKVWDCGEPEKILGRAIQPPKMKHIDQAITNLQNLGALTIPTGKSATGELTELGKVYSELPIDLKYSRFIVLSFCFDLIEPAIVICSILTQEKNFFKIKKTAKRHYEIKKTFDQGTSNDFVALYNAYKDWSRKYGKDKEEFHRSKQTFITREERQWCADHDIDDRVIREVRNVMRDLKRRLIKLHLITQDQRNHYDFGRDQEALFYFNVDY